MKYFIRLAFLLSLSLCLGKAAENEEESQQQQEEQEPYLGLLDYILLVGLGVGAAYYWIVCSEPEKPEPGYIITPTPLAASSSSSSGGGSGFINKMRNSKRRMVVFYGSQTGTAEEFAGRLAKEGARYGLKGLVADPEECDMEDLTQIKSLEEDLEGPTLCVFMMATYGEGDPTDNAQEFYEWLKSDNDLNGLNYAVFGECALPVHYVDLMMYCMFQDWEIKRTSILTPWASLPIPA